MSGDMVPSTPLPKIKFTSVEEGSTERVFKQMGTATRPTSSLKKHHPIAKAKANAVTAPNNGMLMLRPHLHTTNLIDFKKFQRQARIQTLHLPRQEQYDL